MSRFALGLYQKNSFNTSRPVSTAAVFMGATRGKGSTTRKFNFCKARSPTPSLCINQFVNIQGSNPTPTPTPTPTSTWSTVPGAGFFAQQGSPQTLPLYSGVVDNQGNVYVSSINQLSIYSKALQQWQGGTSIGSTLGITTAYLLSNNDVIYIGGNFNTLNLFNSVPLVINYFASYNTTTNTWTNLNPANVITGPITAFTVKNNIIYIAIQGAEKIITYTIATNTFGQTSADYNADSVINNIVIDSQNNIFISGIFTEISGTTNRIFTLRNGSANWENVGGSFNNKINTMVINSNNTIYIGGNFTEVTNGVNPAILTPYIAQWNGATWAALPSSNGDLFGEVNSIIIDSKNNFYIGGGFTTNIAISNTLNYIATWSPSNPAFRALTYGLTDTVSSLFIGNNNLYVLGTFNGYYSNGPPPFPPPVTMCQYMTTWTNI